MADEQIGTGKMPLQAPLGGFDGLFFVVAQALSKMQTTTLVRVVSCTNNGGLDPVGYVDVVPMINQLDSEGLAVPHATIHNVPYFRMQGGANAVIIDPEPGDIGICSFASRDISKVKRTKQPGNPGSGRQFSFSDGLYIGGVLNGAPQQYVQFNAGGIKIYSPSEITLEAPSVVVEASTVEINASTSTTITTPTFTVNGSTVLNGPLNQGTGSAGGSATMQGPLTVADDVTANGTSLHTHQHSGVQPGSGNTGGPI